MTVGYFFVREGVVFLGTRNNGSMLSLRISDETRRSIERLIILYGQELGTKVNKTQAVEMAIAEALRGRDAPSADC